jgi:hypothetical protein
MEKRIIYTDTLRECKVYAEVKDGVLYVLLKEELKEDKIKTGLIVSEIIRRLAK